MNPNAQEFKFNPGASEWKPPADTPPAAPAPAPVAAAAPPEPPVDEDVGEDLDENDPLWVATLKLAEGDKRRALKMLEDPDALMVHPEIKAIMEGGGGDADDDWEKAAEPVVEPEAKADAGALKAPAEASSVAEVKPGKATSPKAAAVAEEEDAGAAEEEVGEGDPREHVNIVFIGHVDAGKSTLSGSILYAMGKVDTRTIERFEREAKQRNRESWFLAFIMDTSEEERAKGKTVEVGRAHFDTETNRYTILDAPGHKNYVPNMIAGAAQADVGILVISARRGEFETGFDRGGQTREHALLAKTLGVQYLVVVINKMDDPTVEWSQERYEECVSKLKPFLKSCGYVIKKDVKFLPIAGITGDNILREVDEARCPWWKQMYNTAGHNTTTPTLISTLDSLALGGRDPDAPLRIPCLDRYFERGCVVLGKVESGTLRRGDEIMISPTRKKTKVEAIYIDEKSVSYAKPGENVLIKFNINVEDIQKGFVLSPADAPCPSVVEVRVQAALVDMLEHRPLFSPGYDCVLHVHTVEIEATCSALEFVIEKGKQMRRPFGRTGQQCVARLKLPISTCMETFAKLPAMGRFTLRDEGKTIAIGKIVDLVK